MNLTYKFAAFLLALVPLVGCGKVLLETDAGPELDAQPFDAQPLIVDAGADAAADEPRPPPGQEFTGAGGRMSSSSFTLDVQLGHPIAQHQIQGATIRLEANTPLKP